MNPFSKLLLVLAVASVALLSGCASIVHGGPRKISMATEPPGASVKIYDRDGKEFVTGTTPFVAKLPVKYRYFQGQNYRVVFELPGYKSAEVQLVPTLSGWYLGNLLIGGLLGMVVIDPLTGSMYNLSPNKIEQKLTPTEAELLRQGGIKVVALSQTTTNERANMVRIN